MNKIKQAVAAGRPSLGVWSVVGSPVVAEMAGRAGLDWVLLDRQHGPVSEHDLLTCIQAVEVGGSVAMVRVGANDPRLIMRALDLGADGVVVPLVSSASEAAAAVSAVRYPPAGSRSFGPVRRYYDAEGQPAAPLCLAMIETRAGLEAIDEIAATPGLDGLFVGPVDLALDLGFGMPDPEDCAVLIEPVHRVVQAAERHGVIAGSVALSTTMAESLLEVGVRLIASGSDVGHINQGFAADAERRRAWLSSYSRRIPAAVEATRQKEGGDRCQP
ncbi:HpcH/HpaI aldolase family protein [Rhodococcus koreensis]